MKGEHKVKNMVFTKGSNVSEPQEEFVDFIKPKNIEILIY